MKNSTTLLWKGSQGNNCHSSYYSPVFLMMSFMIFLKNISTRFSRWSEGRQRSSLFWKILWKFRQKCDYEMMGSFLRFSFDWLAGVNKPGKLMDLFLEKFMENLENLGKFVEKCEKSRGFKKKWVKNLENWKIPKKIWRV